MMFNAKEVGQRIRERRMELSLSLPQAALELHLSADHLRKIEKGTRNPPLELLGPLSNYLDVSIQYLLSGEDEKVELIEQLDKVIHIIQDVKTKI